MPKRDLILRQITGSTLTHAQLDANLAQFFYSSSVSGDTVTLFQSGSGSIPQQTIQLLTASYSAPSVNTGSLIKTGSVSNNILTFTKGDNSTFTLTVATGSFINTGSLYKSSSVNLNTITFTQGDGTTETVTINTGSSSPTASYVSGSNVDGKVATATLADSASFVSASNIQGTVANAVSASYAVSASHEIIKETIATNADTASFVTASNVVGQVASASLSVTSSYTSFDGNRVVSNTELGDLFSASFNAGTSGSISDFLNAVFFPNRGPVFSSATRNFDVDEFTVSGSVVGTTTATDADGHTLTYSTGSYSSDFVRINSSTGQITLNTLASSSRFNTTNRGDGTLAHPFPVTASDGFGGSAFQTVYVHATRNSAPVFRQTSAAGAIITSFTSSRNENATTAGHPHFSIYVTDANSDTITLVSSSLPVSPNGDQIFSVSRTGSRVNISQITSSLDFETTSSLTFSLTASDEHFVANQDGSSRTLLPVTISVTNNVHPTINDQSFASSSESGSSGRSIGNISAADSEDDTITFFNFVTSSKKIDGSNVSTGTYNNSGLNNPSENPFTMNSAGQVTQKVGHFLNSDLINLYQYQVQVKDAFNTASNTATISIPISDDAAPSLSTNGGGNFFIIESAGNSTNITTATSGIAGTVADINTTGTGTSFTSSNSQISIASNGNLSLGFALSGSGTGSGDTIATTITSTNNFGTTGSLAVNVSVKRNPGPTGSYANTSANLNTNLARSGSTISVLTWADNESDTIDHTTFNFTDPSGQLNALRSGSLNVYEIQAKNNLSASTYSMTASIFDEHRFASASYLNTAAIAAAPIGTLTGDTTSHIIESAVSGAVLRSATGFGGGSASDLDVNYSPSYGSAAVQSFTSSNAAIAVSNAGALTLAVNLSGSATSSGDTISTNITYRDQYDNIGSGSVTVNVFGNAKPTGSFTDQTAALTASIATDTNMCSVTITDTETDTPFSMSLSGAGVANIKAVPLNANSSSYQIRAAQNITSAQTISYTASIVDNFDESKLFRRTFTVAAPEPLWYAYAVEGGAYATNEGTSLQMLGDNADNGTPDANTLLAKFASGSMGQGNETFTAFTGIDSEINEAFLIASGSNFTGSRTNIFIEGYNGATGSEGTPNAFLAITFPSGSNSKFSLPSAMDNALGGSTVGEYALFADRPGTGAINDNPQSSFVRYFSFSGSATYPSSSDNKFGVVFTQGDSSTDINYFYMASSGSEPSSTQ